jgi:cysteine synthase
MKNTYLPRFNDWPVPVELIAKELNPFADKGVRLWAVLGYRLPYSTMKIYGVLGLLKAAKAAGKLKGVHTLVEATSGAFGLVLTHFARDEEFGISRVLLIMKKGVPAGKYFPPYYSGAEIREPDPGLSAIATARELGGGGYQSDGSWKSWKSKDGYLNLDQYGNPHATTLYRDIVAPKILEGLAKNNASDFKMFVSPVGTGGTNTGLSEAFRKSQKDLRFIGAMCAPGESIPGMRSIADMKEINLPWHQVIDQIIEVKADPAWLAVLQISHYTGMLVGISSAATYIAALMALKQHEKAGTLESLRGENGFIDVPMIFHDGARPYIANEVAALEKFLGPNAPMPWELLWK